MKEWEGESAQILISFDQAAEFKEPGASSYVLRVVTANQSVQSEGSGLLTQAFANQTTMQGELKFGWSSQIDFSGSFQKTLGTYVITIDCGGVQGLSVGGDQYVVPAPFDCPDGTMRLRKKGVYSDDWVNCTFPFTYH